MCFSYNKCVCLCVYVLANAIWIVCWGNSVCQLQTTHFLMLWVQFNCFEYRSKPRVCVCLHAQCALRLFFFFDRSLHLNCVKGTRWRSIGEQMKWEKKSALNIENKGCVNPSLKSWKVTTVELCSIVSKNHYFSTTLTKPCAF